MSAPAPTREAPRPSRAKAWRRRRLEMREAVRRAWSRLRNLDTVVAVILTVVLGGITGLVIYEVWLGLGPG